MDRSCFNIFSPKHTLTITKDCKGIAIDVVNFKGPTSDRPQNPEEGYLYYNTTLHNYEFWNGSEWIQWGTGGGPTPSEGSLILALTGDFLVLSNTGDTLILN